MRQLRDFASKLQTKLLLRKARFSNFAFAVAWLNSVIFSKTLITTKSKAKNNTNFVYIVILNVSTSKNPHS